MGLPAWWPTRDVERTREKLVNHEPKASDLQAFRETYKKCGLLLLLNNLKVFYEFTGALNRRFFNQSERAYYL